MTKEGNSELSLNSGVIKESSRCQQILVLTLTCCVAQRRLINFSELHFLYVDKKETAKIQIF
jgi:hypothetical protein